MYSGNILENLPSVHAVLIADSPVLLVQTKYPFPFLRNGLWDLGSEMVLSVVDAFSS